MVDTYSTSEKEFQHTFHQPDGYKKDLPKKDSFKHDFHKKDDTKYVSDHDKKTPYKTGYAVVEPEQPKEVYKKPSAPLVEKKSTPLCVDIVGGGSYEDCSAVAYGREIHVITDHEKKAYKIDDVALKRAAGDYFGKIPDDGYLCSPTPYGDLYKRFGWEQVKTTLVPVKTEILECDVKPTIIKSVICKNHKYKPQVVDVSICDNVCNTVKSIWKSDYKLSCNQKIKYNICLDGLKYEDSVIEFKKPWGKEVYLTQDITLGSEYGVTTTLKPYEAVESRLVASYGTIKVKVTYRATVSGGYTIAYCPSYKDNDFWCLPVKGVLKGCGVKASKEVQEILEIKYFADACIELREPGYEQVKRTVYGNEYSAKDYVH